MQTLFIIGNGFDLAHGLPTSYNHFKNYLRAEYQYDYLETSSIWEEEKIIMGGDYGYDVKNCAQIIDYLVSSVGEDISSSYDWRDFERALGVLNFQEIEEEINVQYDKEGDINYSHTSSLYETAYSDLVKIMEFVNTLFKEWINTIEINKNFNKLLHMDTFEEFSKLIERANKPIFLTFNYTETLELIYDQSNITHIHGTKESPIVGHGSKEVVKELMWNQDIPIRRILSNLRKPTEDVLKDNQLFFDQLNTDIKEIYTYGFSFSDVDMIYIKEIIGRINNKNTIWYLQNYNSNKHGEYINLLRKYGFNGDFDTF